MAPNWSLLHEVLTIFNGGMVKLIDRIPWQTLPHFPPPRLNSPTPPPIPLTSPPPFTFNNRLTPLPFVPILPPSHHYQFQYNAQQLFQHDAQTITPEALEIVKDAIASSDVDHKTDTKRKAVARRAVG
ncbi:uncharacterized protein LOC127745560 [Arachis duranensis]|uniref:Uncharacterized protein LOC127745560 n=1 Tax=Arachis duranensis TaxID=130453 RepID=A0A9C6WQI1_ARADU|nr:uncharacterized protein LOC127745560 [Arachis duranensis]